MKEVMKTKMKEVVKEKIKERIREREKSFTLSKILPSIITLLGLCVGLTAVRFAIDGYFIKATTFVLVAGFLDGIDGRLARFLNSTSEFGAQLDSLIDFVNFGIVPGFIIYTWVNHGGDPVKFSWAFVLFWAVCMSLRLARFNVALNKQPKNEVLSTYFFSGIPAPCGAALSMLPMVLFYEFGSELFFLKPKIVILYSTILAVLVASRVPTISIKKIPIRNEYFYLTLIILGSIIVGLVVEPWLTLAAIGLIYITSIPVTIFAYLKISYSK